MLPGSANCGVFVRLIHSARNVMRRSEPIGHIFDTEAFTFLMPPRRNILAPKLPFSAVGAMNANAEAGSKATEVSGFPMVRPRMDGSSKFGRSPPFPSTLPYPGPSGVVTVNGVPFFSKTTAEVVQPAPIFCAQPCPRCDGKSYVARATKEFG